jgi:hypothetical protein
MELLAGYALGSHHSHQGNRKLLNGRRLAKALLALLAVSLCGILAVRFSIDEGHSGAISRIKYVPLTVGPTRHCCEMTANEPRALTVLRFVYSDCMLGDTYVARAL